MLLNFKILAFFWRQFYSIASKKRLLLSYPSFFSTQEQKSRKKGREWATNSLKLPSGKPKWAPKQKDRDSTKMMLDHVLIKLGVQKIFFSFCADAKR